jgi:periplasmic protein CpxP/Spy
MKKAITAVAVLALSGTLAFAATEGQQGFGGHGHGHHRHGMFGKKLAEKLGLSDAQKAQIKDIKKATREANAAFFDQARATRKEFWEAKKAGDTAKMDSLKPTLDSQRAQMKDIRKAEMAKITSVLTPDQQAKLDAMKAEWKAKRGNKE